jgi:virginiamycin A acetyltransferase
MPSSWPNKGDTVVGNDVWIGYGSTIMPGVVTRDVPPYAIVGGSPASVLRYRFDEPTIASLLAMRWWEWDIERITANVATICSPHVAALAASAPPP